MQTTKLFPNYEYQVINNQVSETVEIRLKTNVRFEDNGKYYERAVYEEFTSPKQKEEYFLQFYNQTLQSFLNKCYNTIFLAKHVQDLDAESKLPISEKDRLYIKNKNHEGILNEFQR